MLVSVALFNGLSRLAITRQHRFFWAMWNYFWVVHDATGMWYALAAILNGKSFSFVKKIQGACAGDPGAGIWLASL